MTVPRSACTLTLKTSIGILNGDATLYGAVFDALATRPHTLGELQALPAFKGRPITSLMEVAALLASSGQATAYLHAGGKPEAAARMNAALVRLLRYSDEHQVLCSPLTGNGVGADVFDRLVYSVLAQRKGTVYLDAVTRQVWEKLDALGRRMIKDGVTLQEEADNLAELRPRVEAILRDKVPVWQQLKLL